VASARRKAGSGESSKTEKGVGMYHCVQNPGKPHGKASTVKSKGMKHRLGSTGRGAGGNVREHLFGWIAGGVMLLGQDSDGRSRQKKKTKLVRSEQLPARRLEERSIGRPFLRPTHDQG